MVLGLCQLKISKTQHVCIYNAILQIPILVGRWEFEDIFILAIIHVCVDSNNCRFYVEMP